MNTLLFIGRFQPFHRGHMETLRYGLDHAERVVVGLGSAGAPASKHNPWSPSERQDMIGGSMEFADSNRLIFRNIYDCPGNDKAWIDQVREIMAPYKEWGLLGVEKDATSYYLFLFPDIVTFQPEAPDLKIEGTDVRRLFFAQDEAWKALVPHGTAAVLQEYQRTERYKFNCKGIFL